MNLILFGLPSSGKTTIGQKLATHLSLPFIDTDRMIEQLYQKRFKVDYSCREIYQKFGEKEFRLLESEVIFSLDNQSNTIIAIGGGAICNSRVVCFLQRLGKFIHLRITKQTLYSRLLLDPPAFLSKVEDIACCNDFYEARLEYIKKIPSHTIDVDDKAVKEVINILSSFYSYINPGYYGEQ